MFAKTSLIVLVSILALSASGDGQLATVQQLQQPQQPAGGSLTARWTVTSGNLPSMNGASFALTSDGISTWNGSAVYFGGTKVIACVTGRDKPGLAFANRGDIRLTGGTFTVVRQSPLLITWTGIKSDFPAATLTMTISE